MKLIFDQNLSRALVHRLADRFPDSTHVTDAGLERATDTAVWTWARNNHEVLVTKDRDFERADEFPGPPPRCILITLGNASTDDVEELIRQAVADVDVFEHDNRRLLAIP